MEHQLHNAGQRGLGARLKMMVASAGVRKAVSVCLLAFVFTVATGFSVVNYHAKMLLVQARVTDTMDPNLGVILIGVCQMAGNLAGASVIDRVGRKTLLYISSAFLAFSQAGLGTYFYLELNSPEAAEALEDYRSVMGSNKGLKIYQTTNNF
jgi:predicted MFS family arabinose efflux permease